MPIIHFINNKNHTTSGMRNVLNYISKKEKAFENYEVVVATHIDRGHIYIETLDNPSGKLKKKNDFASLPCDVYSIAAVVLPLFLSLSLGLEYSDIDISHKSSYNYISKFSWRIDDEWTVHLSGY